MEITEAVRTQILFPGLIVSFVLVFAVLVFVFGFKSVEDFPFDKLAAANDYRKPAGKKRKGKDKKVQPSQISSAADSKHKSTDGEKTVSQTSKSKNIEKAVARETPKANVKQDKKQSTVEVLSNNHSTALKETKSNRAVEKHVKTQLKEKENKEKANKNVTTNKKTQSKGKENVNHQNKKNKEHSSNKLNENTFDDDGDGEWEQAFSRKDKKTKKPLPTEEEPVDKLIKSDSAGLGKKKKVLNQNEHNEPIKVATDNEPQVTPPLNESSKQEAEVAAAPAVLPATVKKVKEQKKETTKSLKEVSNKKTVDPIVEEEQSSKSKDKHPPKESLASREFIENEKQQNDTDVKVSEAKPTKEKQTQDPIADTVPVFDELGDTWKEAKTAKKQSKKKVRKAE